MRTFKLTGVAVIACFLLTGYARGDDSATGSAHNSTDTKAGSAVKPDNTGINKRDRSDSALTPEDQGGSEADREITRRIRRAIHSNKDLSVNAKNIKIITVNGKVTLRGPVQNEHEQKTIKEMVQKMGIASVNNQLEVKPVKH
jgi:hyperosmotically inducible periplasmic protein